MLADARAAVAVRRLHAALMGPASALDRDERLADAVATLYPRAAGALPRGGRDGPLAARVRDHLHARYLDDLGMDELARVAGRSRYAVYRAFQAAYGMAPSDYQRLLRLRTARDLLAAGEPPGEVAAAAGFADQAHLTRWFVRCFGVTPGAFRRAG